MLALSASPCPPSRTLLQNFDVPWGPVMLCRKEYVPIGNFLWMISALCSKLWSCCVFYPRLWGFPLLCCLGCWRIIVLVGLRIISWGGNLFSAVLLVSFCVQWRSCMSGLLWCLSQLMPRLPAFQVSFPWFYLIPSWISWGVLLLRYGDELLTNCLLWGLWRQPLPLPSVESCWRLVCCCTPWCVGSNSGLFYWLGWVWCSRGFYI